MPLIDEQPPSTLPAVAQPPPVSAPGPARSYTSSRCGGCRCSRDTRPGSESRPDGGFRPPGLEQQHPPPGIGAQPVGDEAAGGPGADDHIVEDRVGRGAPRSSAGTVKACPKRNIPRHPEKTVAAWPDARRNTAARRPARPEAGPRAGRGGGASLEQRRQPPAAAGAVRRARSRPVTALVALNGVSKSFAGVRVLKDVDFDVLPGEVHALLGENGAGKSTLIKIIAGVHAPDGGTIRIGDEELTAVTPREAVEGGIATVYQELLLFPELTVAENVFLGHAPKTGARHPRLGRRCAARARAAARLARQPRPRRRRQGRHPLGRQPPARRDRQGAQPERPASSSWTSRPRRSPTPTSGG